MVAKIKLTGDKELIKQLRELSGGGQRPGTARDQLRAREVCRGGEQDLRVATRDAGGAGLRGREQPLDRSVSVGGIGHAAMIRVRSGVGIMPRWTHQPGCCRCRARS